MNVKEELLELILEYSNRVYSSRFHYENCKNRDDSYRECDCADAIRAREFDTAWQKRMDNIADYVDQLEDRIGELVYNEEMEFKEKVNNQRWCTCGNGV